MNTQTPQPDLNSMFDRITCAEDAKTLHAIKAEVRASTMHPENRIALCTMVDLRFSQLNAAAVGPQKGRWP